MSAKKAQKNTLSIQLSWYRELPGNNGNTSETHHRNMRRQKKPIGNCSIKWQGRSLSVEVS